MIKTVSFLLSVFLIVALSACSSVDSAIEFDAENFDQDKAIKQAKDGDIKSQYNLGLSSLQKGNYDQATEWLCEAARAAHGPAQYEIARIYAGYTADAVAEPVVATFWAEEALKNGQKKAQAIVDQFKDDLPKSKIRYLRSIRLSGAKYAPCVWSQVDSGW